MKAKHMVKFIENFSHEYPDLKIDTIGITEAPGGIEGAIRIYIQEDGKTVKYYTLTYKIDENDVIYIKEVNK
jgi:hypothetical protein